MPLTFRNYTSVAYKHKNTFQFNTELKVQNKFKINHNVAIACNCCYNQYLLWKV